MDNRKFKVVYPLSGMIKQKDLFLISLSNEMGTRAVGIILSGYGADGTAGCKHIKDNEGNTFARDFSAEVDYMPLSALACGTIDFALSLYKISDNLKKMTAGLKL